MLYFVMTVDVDPPIPSNPNPRIVKNGVAALLKLFKRYKIKATFFIPAVVAEKFPEVMKDIVSQGHEVACHGLKHDPRETTISIDGELRIIRKATEIIQSVTGVKPVGFRAPLFRFNESYWTALQKNEYAYDSSIICFRFYGGLRTFPTSKPFPLPVSKTIENRGLIEIPVSAYPFLPFPLGGAHFRIFGLRWTKMAIKINLLSRKPIVFYIHPKDVDPRTQGRSWWWYRNTINCMKMLEELVNYAIRKGAEFITAYELARLAEAQILKTDVNYDNQSNL